MMNLDLFKYTESIILVGTEGLFIRD